MKHTVHRPTGRAAGGGPAPPRRKRSDLMVEQVRRWIAAGAVTPGDRLPREIELQRMFGLSKGTTREALKSLEVQGLVLLRTGPDGGARITAAPFPRIFQLVQNYMFFQSLSTATIYQVRRLLEPELAASATPHLSAEAIARLEQSVRRCMPGPASAPDPVGRRAEDLHFHDILAEAAPNPLLRFTCQIINEMLRLIVFRSPALRKHGEALGAANVVAHQALLRAIKARDSERVRRVMFDHLSEVETLVLKMQGTLERPLVLDVELDAPIRFPGVRERGARGTASALARTKATGRPRRRP